MERMKAYDAATNIAARLLAVGTYHGSEEQGELWVRALQRVVECEEVAGRRLVVWSNLRAYPALVLLYSASLGAVAAGRFAVIGSLARRVMVEADSSLLPGCTHGLSWMIRLPNSCQDSSVITRRLAIICTRVLRDVAREIVPSDQEYERAFDRFEYLWALMHVDATLGTEHWHEGWGPVGRFGWQRRPRGDRESAVVAREMERSGGAWPPLAAGLFAGSLDRLTEVKDAFDGFASKLDMAW